MKQIANERASQNNVYKQKIKETLEKPTVRPNTSKPNSPNPGINKNVHDENSKEKLDYF